MKIDSGNNFERVKQAMSKGQHEKNKLMKTATFFCTIIFIFIGLLSSSGYEEKSSGEDGSNPVLSTF